VATTEDELERALDSARRHQGPTLIDVRVDPSAYDDTLRAVRG
jgi:thiamine pyrophosphate-dependent acetolactate synthase large subunit-like protein